jgi:hypothetical protein
MNELKKLDHLPIESLDVFPETEIAPNVFKIKYQGATMKVKMSPPLPGSGTEEPNIEILQTPIYYDKRKKKLIGYVLYEIAPRYVGKALIKK